MQPVEYLVHFSNLLLLVSYSVRDILWLRWFAVGAAVANLPYYLAQPTVLWPPVIWGGVFMLINLYQIARIYLERRPVVLSRDEQQLYDLGFKTLRPREFVSLLLTGQWRDASRWRTHHHARPTRRAALDSDLRPRRGEPARRVARQLRAGPDGRPRARHDGRGGDRSMPHSAQPGRYYELAAAGTAHLSRQATRAPRRTAAARRPRPGDEARAADARRTA
jgi:hypothetical protein